MNEDWVFKRGDSLFCQFEPLFRIGARWHTPGSGGFRTIWQLLLSHLDCRAAHQQMDQEKGTSGSLYSESVQELGQKSVVLLEQIKTIDKRRILSYIGKVSREEMRAVDEALQVSLDIHIPEEMEAP